MVISLRTAPSLALLSSVRILGMMVAISMLMTRSVVDGGLVVVLGAILVTVAPVAISLTRLSICIVIIRAVVVSVRLPIRASTGRVAGTTVSVVAIILVFAVIPSSAPPAIT